jgi:hypothetical protein
MAGGKLWAVRPRVFAVTAFALQEASRDNSGVFGIDRIGVVFHKILLGD